MTISYDKLLALKIPEVEHSYGPKDCMLYALGLGLGYDPVDENQLTFVYEKNGQKTEFTADKFPADFGDSYKFINRYDKLIRKGNAEAAIKDFTLVTAGGTDTTQDLLQEKGYKLFLFTKGFEEDSPNWNKAFSVIFTMARAKKIPVYFITGDYDNVAGWADKQGIGRDITVLKCDATAIKTAARANPTLYLIKKGFILNKWSYADFELALPDINGLPAAE